MRGGHRLYEAVTQDEYELPVAVADTVGELARQVGVSKLTILSVISHAKAHKRGCVYHRIEYTEREWAE